MPPSVPRSHNISPLPLFKEEETESAPKKAPLEPSPTTSAAAKSSPTVPLTSLPLADPFSNSLYGGGMYGGGMYGGGMYGGYGGMMSPYGGGLGPLSGLNQLLFGVQSVVFSLSQAVQIIGMNTAAIKNLLESATAMFDHAVATWHEMQVLERQALAGESEEDRKRRRRLRALRWAMVTAATYAGYRLLRAAFGGHKRQPKLPASSTGQRSMYPTSHSPYTAGSSYPASPYASSSGYSGYY